MEPQANPSHLVGRELPREHVPGPVWVNFILTTYTMKWVLVNPISATRNPRHREVKELTPGHTAAKRWVWDSNPGSPAPFEL